MMNQLALLAQPIHEATNHPGRDIEPTPVVYLIHFDVPLGDLCNPRGRAQHYIGYTENLEQRLEQHRNGNGSAIMAAVSEAGIGWRVVRTWEGGRDLERRLKRRKNSPKLCPICSLGRQLVMEIEIEIEVR
jgi:predicted GIY-YIG superfamily endonuclease